MRRVVILWSVLILCGAGLAGAQGTSCEVPLVSVDLAETTNVFPPEPLEVLEAPKHGPCTMSYNCAASSGCGNNFISCSGQEYCEMGSESVSWPSSCRRNIWVRCDGGPKIKCLEPLLP